MRVDGILFDKDGTLFDFGATWNGWAGDAINQFAEGDPRLAARIAEALRYDLAEGAFFADSPIIAGTNREAAEAVARALPDRDVDVIEEHLMRSAATAPLAEAVPLAPFLDGLVAAGLRMGVMTNDTEYGALSHLDAAGVTARFDFVAGFDSGFGAKPHPGPLLAFADATGLNPSRVVMVGDSTHDLIAGRAAGMQTVGVLTGMALASDLAPFADDVLPDIGHLPGWIGV